jgi:hypothetical protein
MGWDGGSVKWIDLIFLLVFMLMEREIQSNSFEVVFFSSVSFFLFFQAVITTVCLFKFYLAI